MTSSTQFLGVPYGDVIFEEQNNDITVQAANLRAIRVDRGGSRWVWSVDFVGGKSEDIWGAFMSHIVSNKNRAFDIAIPQGARVLRDIRLPSVVVPGLNDPAMAGSRTVVVNALEGLVLPTGAMIRFSGHSKVYMVESASAPIGAKAGFGQRPGERYSVRIYPALVHAVGGNEVVGTNNVLARVRHATTNGSLSQSGLTQSVTLRFEEEIAAAVSP